LSPPLLIGRQAGGREGNGGDDDELTGSEGEEEDGREAVAVWTLDK